MARDMVRISGLNSGLDTESIISAYTSVQKKHVQDAKNKKTLNTWTQDAWKDINNKIYSFYSKTCSTNRLRDAYAKTKVTTSNSALSVMPGAGAVKGVQSAKIKGTASAAYLTGAEIGISSDTDDLVSTLGITEGSTIKFANANGEEKTIQIGGSSDGTTPVVNNMKDLIKELKSAGINANYDATNKRIFLSAKATGEGNDFSLTDGGQGALEKLGLATAEQGAKNAAVKVDASSAILELNGATFKSDSNTFVINGSTYTINGMPSSDETISITTATDYDGVYDVVKDMIKEYNDLIGEMSKLYNADSSKGYDPLTDEQKEAMSEKEIEEWEKKIKDSLLRNDKTLYDVMDVLTTTTFKGFEVNGKTTYLSDFGISTLGYFEAEANEKSILHIDGDKDDSNTASKDDKLKAFIASNPEGAASFFAQFSQELYTKLYSKMGSTNLSSIYKVYNDKQLKTESSDLDKRVKELEDKLADIEDKYYRKFTAMEKMLASMNSQTSSLSSLFGQQ